MTQIQNEPTTERAFLHELCNATAVTHGILHLIMMKAKKNPSEMRSEDLLLRVEKALESVEKMNKLIFDRRSILLQHSAPATSLQP